MTDDAIKVGDLIIDEETGEILQLPEGVGDPFEWLTHKANEAAAAIKAWTAIGGMYKSALGELLTKAGVKSMRTQYGAPGWRSRRNRKVRIDRLPQVIDDHELSHGDVLTLLLCASELSVTKVEALELPGEAMKELIDEQPASTWVQISPATPMPPDVENVRRPS